MKKTEKEEAIEHNVIVTQWHERANNTAAKVFMMLTADSSLKVGVYCSTGFTKEQIVRQLRKAADGIESSIITPNIN